MAAKKSTSLLGMMDEETKNQIKDLQQGQFITLADGRKVGEVDPTLLYPDPNNIRKDKSEYNHDALAESIEDEGLQNPPTVKPAGEKYQIVTGEQRWTAWMILYEKDPVKFAKLPVIIEEKSSTENSKQERAKTIKKQVFENFSRSDGTVFDLADAICELWTLLGKEYAVAALEKTQHASNSTALSRLKSISNTNDHFREKILASGIKGKGTIETLSKIERKSPEVFEKTIKDYNDGKIDRSLDAEANEVWSNISGKIKKNKSSAREGTETNVVSEQEVVGESEVDQDTGSSLESPAANLIAENISVVESTLVISIKNGSKLVVQIPEGFSVEVSE